MCSAAPPGTAVVPRSASCSAALRPSPRERPRRPRSPERLSVERRGELRRRAVRVLRPWRRGRTRRCIRPAGERRCLSGRRRLLCSSTRSAGGRRMSGQIVTPLYHIAGRSQPPTGPAVFHRRLRGRRCRVDDRRLRDIAWGRRSGWLRVGADAEAGVLCRQCRNTSGTTPARCSLDRARGGRGARHRRDGDERDPWCMCCSRVLGMAQRPRHELVPCPPRGVTRRCGRPHGCRIADASAYPPPRPTRRAVRRQSGHCSVEKLDSDKQR